jgi:hypothetical protein
MRLEANAFHTGIDISASPETPVFDVEPGTVYFIDSTAIAVRSGARTFQYWHITPAVWNRQYVRRHALLGWTLPAFNHLHLSELVRGKLVNPLRPEALGPFDDDTPPTTSRVEFWRVGTTLETAAVHGTVDIVADSSDTAAGVEPRPWPVAPALIRWRITTGDEQDRAWQVAVDFRQSVPSSPRFALVYAPGTRPNHLGRPGRFRFYLAHGWDSTRVPNGRNLLEVEASDMRGNTRAAIFAFDAAN